MKNKVFLSISCSAILFFPNAGNSWFTRAATTVQQTGNAAATEINTVAQPTIAAAIEESARLRARLLALERIGTDLNKTVRRMVISMVTIAVLHSAWHAWRWYNNKEKQDKAS